MSLSIMGNVEVIPAEELHMLPDPEPMGSRHHPEPHARLMRNVDVTFKAHGMEISNVVPRLSKCRKKMLATFDINILDTSTPKYQDSEVKLIGIASNFQDQSGCVTIGAGEHVFACLNETVSVEFKVRHKSTKNLQHNIRAMIWDQCEALDDIFDQITGRRKFLSGVPVDDHAAAYHVIDAMKRGVINSRELPRVVEYWEQPEHDAFKPRNYWSLYNAFSGFFQDRNPFDISDRSAKLNRQFEDIYTGIQEDNWETTSEYERLCTDADLEVHKDLEGYES